MPDPTKQTISASQAPALWNVSPWCTRWMLFKSFADDMDISQTDDSRMSWGRKLEPLILQQAASDLAMEVHPNATAQYVRRGQLGCTRDAEIVAPDLGPGVVEAKAIFDYRTWMQDWGGGKNVPRHYEIQVQQQMLVGDPETGPYKWGVIAAWVAGEVHYFRREPVASMWETMQKEAAAFFESIAKHQEPDPFGAPVEIPFLSAIERETGKVVDLSTGAQAQALATAARLLKRASDEASACERAKKVYKAKLLAAIGDAEKMLLAGGIEVKASTVSRKGFTVEPSTYTTLKVFAPRTDDSLDDDVTAATREAFQRSVNILEAG